MNKKMVLDALENLPEEFDTEELYERLILIDKIGKGLADVDQGRMISIEESRKRMKEKWEARP